MQTAEQKRALSQLFKEYAKERQKIANSGTEASFEPALKALLGGLNALLGRDFQITNQPKYKMHEGQPDFQITERETDALVGLVECKAPQTTLNYARVGEF